MAVSRSIMKIFTPKLKRFDWLDVVKPVNPRNGNCLGVICPKRWKIKLPVVSQIVNLTLLPATRALVVNFSKVVAR